VTSGADPGLVYLVLSSLVLAAAGIGLLLLLH